MSKSSTTTETRPFRAWPPIHPGEILREEFLEPLRLKPYTLAKRLETSRARMERLVREEVPVTVDTALRLSRFFGTSPEFWLNLQQMYDLTIAETTSAETLAGIEPLKQDAA
jgi:addiction module HigA family antidote